MKIFKDIITGDELCSDIYPMKLVDDLYYEVEGKSVTETTEISDAMFGGNASAEGGADEAAEGAAAVTGINVVLANRLVETGFDKKAYGTYVKDYMKKVKAKLEKDHPDRVDHFVKGMPAVVKKILGDFKNFQFFIGESMTPEGMAIPMNYREDGVTPYFILFKDGLEEEKC